MVRRDTDDQAFIAEMMRRVKPGIALKSFMNGLELVQFLEQMPVVEPVLTGHLQRVAGIAILVEVLREAGECRSSVQTP